MGFMDKVKGEATKLRKTAAEHTEQIEHGIEKGAEMVDKKTGGKHHDKIASATEKAKDAVEKLDD